MTFSFTNQEYLVLQTALEQASLHLQDLSNKAKANEKFLTDQEKRALFVATSLSKQMLDLSTKLNSEVKTSMLEQFAETRII